MTSAGFAYLVFTNGLLAFAGFFADVVVSAWFWLLVSLVTVFSFLLSLSKHGGR